MVALGSTPVAGTLLEGTSPAAFATSGEESKAVETTPPELGRLQRIKQNLEAVKRSGATPKAQVAGVPLSGAPSLSAFDSKSPFLQRPKWSGAASSNAGIFSEGLPLKTEVETTADASHAREDHGETATLSTDGEKELLLPLVGCRLADLGGKVFQLLLEVLPLRGQPKGDGSESSLFPLPTSRGVLLEHLPGLVEHDIPWLLTICVSLNSFYGCELFSERLPNQCQILCLQRLAADVMRLRNLNECVTAFDWDQFFSTRSIDYKGDEVKTARSFSWENIKPALPNEIGRVPLSEVCTLGAKHYVEHFDLYLKRYDQVVLPKAPRVMVPDESWAEVCQGLVSSGICTYLTENEVVQVGGKRLLNGLFGVTKDEWHEGHEVFRLIMNMIPLNSLAEPLKGDVETLPMWSLMTPYFIQPDEQLLVSSEDVRCFFYTMSVPSSWYKYMAFNKPVPPGIVPDHLRGETIYLASKVLPMGFLNSVSLAQHVHRNLALWSGSPSAGIAEVNQPECEIRKDLPATVGNPSWRIYLDNYDLLEKVKAVDGCSLQGSDAPAVLSLRQEYEVWEIPRNLKKSVSRSTFAEVQGAQIDGVLGIAYPRESKLLKYIAASLSLVQKGSCTQREAQVVGGGLVYISMFKRPLLGSLNGLWAFITSFATTRQIQKLPSNCKLEILRFVSLIPLAKLDFRLQYHEQVTCSDASSTGGGICSSQGLSRLGTLVSAGKLRGELPELRTEHRVFSIGLFDGIGALRVALDLIGATVIGHVSVEQDAAAQRVVESHFPEAKTVPDVADVDEELVASWARDYSQCSLVVIGAGPPCQGVSGLNASRKGALRDQRSSLFIHVKRIWKLVQHHFPWCQVHSLMESVQSMDECDRKVMSADFGDEPWACDAGYLTWANRPRLYWISWSIHSQEGATLIPAANGQPAQVILEATQDLEEDCHRYPPYQYLAKNLVINKRDEMRLPSILEKEYIMGFPINYTLACCPKSQRGTQAHLDKRRSLIGNSWSVPVVSWFLSQLLSQLGLCPAYTPQQVINMLNPLHQTFLQSRLWRQPLRSLRGQPQDQGQVLVGKLGHLVSVKGEDILLTTPSSQLTKYHRLRASVPGKLWKWAVVAGWRWRGSPEHINGLELRAVLTSLRWRIEHKLHIGCRMLHLVDSLVVLHALSRGRSSRKLRRSFSKVNALLLCSGSQVLWGYIHTDQNPADKPSRWGRKVKTKFRHAA
eukprot:Skav216598  [mRNA]  locus=scaffold2855:145436:149216:+ [translate_table: standard]